MIRAIDGSAHDRWRAATAASWTVADHRREASMSQIPHVMQSARCGASLRVPVWVVPTHFAFALRLFFVEELGSYKNLVIW